MMREQWKSRHAPVHHHLLDPIGRLLFFTALYPITTQLWVLLIEHGCPGRLRYMAMQVKSYHREMEITLWAHSRQGHVHMLVSSCNVYFGT
jgi:hypothetical protein